MGWFKRLFAGAPPTSLFAGAPPISTEPQVRLVTWKQQTKLSKESLAVNSNEPKDDPRSREAIREEARSGTLSSTARPRLEARDEQREGMRDKRVSDSVTDIAFSAGAELLACTSGYQLEVWDSREDRAILQIGDSSRVNAVAFSPGGQTVAIGIWEAVKLYDLTSCRLNADLCRKTSSHVRVVGFSPAGDILVCGESTIQVWRLPQNEFVRNLQPGHQVAGLAFSPDNEQLITAGNNLLLWDLRTGDLLAKVDDSGPTWDAAQFTTEGTKLVASGGIYANDLHFGIWDMLTGKADVKDRKSTRL